MIGESGLTRNHVSQSLTGTARSPPPAFLLPCSSLISHGVTRSNVDSTDNTLFSPYLIILFSRHQPCYALVLIPRFSFLVSWIFVFRDHLDGDLTTPLYITRQPRRPRQSRIFVTMHSLAITLLTLIALYLPLDASADPHGSRIRQVRRRHHARAYAAGHIRRGDDCDDGGDSASTCTHGTWQCTGPELQSEFCFIQEGACIDVV